jgi:ribosomal protein S18 acetylase RimI-like enzyme
VATAQQLSPEPLRVRALRGRDCAAALARLRTDPRGNLFLIDLVERLDSPPNPGEAGVEVLAAWCGPELVGVASTRPTVVLETGLSPAALAALLPPLARLPSGLVRSKASAVAPLWSRLAARGRRSLVDRTETSLVLTPEASRFVDPPEGIQIRNAEFGDLPALVDAARASLREEGRPDPFVGDPRGFRRWVRSRLPRAVVASDDGRVVFVAYADVRLLEGWLLQGVYTWPDRRRQGLASAGVSALCRQAFAEGTAHVQLSVVAGNRAGVRLYEKLGFSAFEPLRTLLFV